MRVSLLLTAALLAGCSGTGSAPSTPSPGSGSVPMSIGFTEDGFVRPDATFTVGVRLSGEKSLTTKKYGALLGYFKGAKSAKTKVVTIPLGSSVVFDNVDTSRPHTGSFLGDASKTGADWPASFDGSSTQSSAGTDISTASFSTGTLSPGTTSLTYAASVPGFYMFGCAFHYDSNGMRDVIIVK